MMEGNQILAKIRLFLQIYIRQNKNRESKNRFYKHEEFSMQS